MHTCFQPAKNINSSYLTIIFTKATHRITDVSACTIKEHPQNRWVPLLVKGDYGLKFCYSIFQDKDLVSLPYDLVKFSCGLFLVI